MFFTKIASDEIANSFANEIIKMEEESAKIGVVSADITRYLENAAKILKECGFKDEANTISKLADDMATKNLDSKKMTVNLQEHGTVLNLPTENATDILDEMKGKDHGWADDDGGIGQKSAPTYEDLKKIIINKGHELVDEYNDKLPEGWEDQIIAWLFKNETRRLMDFFNNNYTGIFPDEETLMSAINDTIFHGGTVLRSDIIHTLPEDSVVDSDRFEPDIEDLSMFEQDIKDLQEPTAEPTKKHRYE